MGVVDINPRVCLGNNDRSARVRSGFDCIIRLAPEGAGRTTPEQTGHYSHYNTKLTNSRCFPGNSYRIALSEPQSWPSCSCRSSEHCHPLCTQIKAIARIVLNEGHKLTCLIRCMCLQVFSPCVDLCLSLNELLYMTKTQFFYFVYHDIELISLYRVIVAHQRTNFSGKLCAP